MTELTHNLIHIMLSAGVVMAGIGIVLGAGLTLVWAMNSGRKTRKQPKFGRGE